jgi:hypothetical protein
MWEYYIDLLHFVLFLLQRLLQYFTSLQFFFHFLRHVNGSLQTIHIFSGRYSFFTLKH